MVKTRFAPSPTGFLHVGGLRTALFSYLYAKKHQGAFIIRIEDTDQERYVEGGIENILRSLEWCSIEPDEGVKLKNNGLITEVGEQGPYIQSKRLDKYQPYAEQLIEQGDAYYCFCSKERLAEIRRRQEILKQPTMYDGHCREIPLVEARKRVGAGEEHVVRLRMPREGKTTFRDLIRGEVSFDNALIDDQVLLKSDGFPTYHLAVVADDHLMEITHVIRAEEWLSSTPKHIVLYKMFGWEVPEFAHLSLLVNEQRQKLSKRHGDVAVEDYKAKGYLSEALVNFIAFLGWNPGDDREIFSLAELEQEFTLERVTKSAAVFNLEKLNWYNQQYLRSLSLEEVTLKAIPFLLNAGLITERRTPSAEQFTWLEKVVALEKERIVTLKEIPEAVAFIFAEKIEYDSDLLVWKKSTRDDAKEKLANLRDFLNIIQTESWNCATLEAKVGEWIKERGFGIGDVLWPMRVALSGQKNSPGPFEMAEVLGKEKTLARIHQAGAKL